MRKKPFLVCGIGTNDADGPVTTGAPNYGVRTQCPFYHAWSGMMHRCYNPNWHKRGPTYIGCSVVPEWHAFSAFRSWMLTQPWEGNHLDKDILFLGNKVYSPTTCVFVPQALNKFMNGNRALRGGCPVGVSVHKKTGKFQGSCCDPATRKQEYLGLFDTPEEAHEAWRARKHQHACTYADQQTDPRLAQALRTRYSPKQDQTQ